MILGSRQLASFAIAILTGFGALGMLGATPPADAQRTPVNLDAVGAVRYALDHAPAILAKKATVDQLTATFAQRRATEYPSFSGQLQNQIARSSNAQGSFAQFGIAPVSNFSQNTAQVVSQYNLYNATAQIGAEQAKRNAESASADLHLQEEQTTLDVSNAFYSLAARREAIVLAEQDLAYQQQLLDIARLSEKVGRVAGVDVLRAQVAATRSQSNLVQVRADEANAREALAVQIGASPDATFALPSSVPEPPMPKASLASLTAIAKVTRPEVLAAKATLQSARLGDAGIDSDLHPTVQVNGSFGNQTSPTNFVLQQQQIDLSNAAAVANFNLEHTLFPGVTFPAPILSPPVTRGNTGFWQFNITSSFALPIIDYGTRAANHRAARAQIASASASYTNALDFVESDVRAAARNLQAASDKLDLAKQSAQLARESARIAQLQYKNGLISFTDATSTEQTALSAENDLVAARVTYVVALVKLRLALGPPDPVAAADLRGL
jgi:outer membrane protein TolC